MNYFRHFVAMPLAKQVHTQKTFQCFMLGQDGGITFIIEIIKPSWSCWNFFCYMRNYDEHNCSLNKNSLLIAVSEKHHEKQDNKKYFLRWKKVYVLVTGNLSG